MNRRRRRRLLTKLRLNLKALGNSEADSMTDDQLQAIAERFGTLEQMVAITDSAAAIALDYAAAMRKVQVQTSVSREDVKAAADDILHLAQEPKPGHGTHDDAGELVKLRGGPMNGYLVREGAPVLFGTWSKSGAYSRADPPDRDEDGTEIATWEPA